MEIWPLLVNRSSLDIQIGLESISRLQSASLVLYQYESQGCSEFRTFRLAFYLFRAFPKSLRITSLADPPC